MQLALPLKSYASKLNFLLGRKPALLRYSRENVHTFIPSSYRAVFIISCDFELAWAWRFAKEINGDLQKARALARKERENMPILLNLCEQFDIPVTWGIVGHLFLEQCSRAAGKAHADLIQPTHLENEYWKFNSGEWFDHDPCCSWREALEWYAPDIIEKIKHSKVKHEIACHTFSHVDCREKVCPEELLKREIRAYKELASRYQLALTSFIFPGNFIGNLKVLKEEGFISYRVDKDVLGFPEKDAYGLWKLPTTACIAISPYGWPLDYYIKKYTAIIQRAIKHNRMCHFWFHPSTDQYFLKNILSALFSVINANRDTVYVTTMGDYSTKIDTFFS